MRSQHKAIVHVYLALVLIGRYITQRDRLLPLFCVVRQHVIHHQRVAVHCRVVAALEYRRVPSQVHHRLLRRGRQVLFRFRCEVLRCVWHLRQRGYRHHRHRTVYQFRFRQRFFQFCRRCLLLVRLHLDDEFRVAEVYDALLTRAHHCGVIRNAQRRVCHVRSIHCVRYAVFHKLHYIALGALYHVPGQVQALRDLIYLRHAQFGRRQIALFLAAHRLVVAVRVRLLAFNVVAVHAGYLEDADRAFDQVRRRQRQVRQAAGYCHVLHAILVYLVVRRRIVRIPREVQLRTALDLLKFNHFDLCRYARFRRRGYHRRVRLAALGHLIAFAVPRRYPE